MNKTQPSWRIEVGIALTLAFAASLPFLRILVLTGHLPLIEDALMYDLEMTGRVLMRSGEVPLWNPYNWLGSPVFADPRLLFYYPMSFIVRLFPLNTGMNLDFILHFWVGGLGLYVLMRDLTPGSRLPAFFAAVSYVCSGVFFPRISDVHIPMVRTTVWLAWVLWSYRRLIIRPGALWAVMTAFFVALTVISGSPSGIMRSLLVLMLYAGYVAVRFVVRSNWKRLGKLALWSALSMTLAVLLTAYKVVPAAEVFPRLARVDTPYDASEAARVVLNPVQLTTIAVPLQWYDIDADSHYAFGDFIEPNIYAGLITVLVGMLAFTSPEHHQRRRALALLAFGLLGLVLAANLFSYWSFVYRFAPFLRMPGRFALWWMISASMLGGLGFRAMQQHYAANPESFKRLFTWLLRGGLVVTVLAGAIALVWTFRGETLATAILNRGYFSGIGASTVINSQQYSFAELTLTLLMLSILIWFMRRGMRKEVVFPLFIAALFIEMQFFTWPLVQDWKNLNADLGTAPITDTNLDPAFIRHEVSMYYYRVPSVNTNRDQTYLQDVADVRKLGMNGGRATQLAGSGFVPAEIADTTDPRLHPVEGSWNPPLYEYEGNLPRVYLVPAIAVVDTDEQAFAYIASDEFDPYAQAVLTIEPGESPPDLPLDPAPPVTQQAEITEYRNNSLRAEVTADQPVLVVFTEMYYEDWYATLDGDPAAIWHTNYILRGIYVEAGTHTIEMQYRPVPARIAYAVSGLVLIGMLAVLGQAIYRNWRDQRAQSALVEQPPA